MQHFMSGLLMWVVSVSQYPEPASMPDLKVLSHQQMENMVCAGKPCNAVAYYDHHASIIYYDDSLDIENSDVAKGFIVHELVHFLQDEAGKMTNTPLPCEDYVALEREAYQVQQAFLTAHQMMTFEVETALRLLGRVCYN